MASTAFGPAAQLPRFGSGAPRAWRVLGAQWLVSSKMGAAISLTIARPMPPPGHDPTPDRCYGVNIPGRQ